MQAYDALLTFGTAVDDETLALPDQVYRRLDRLAVLYGQSARLGVVPLVIVSGFQRSWRVYRDNLLRDKNGEPVRECDSMADYLRGQHGIEAAREGRSASIGDNLVYSKLLLMERLARPAMARTCIVTLDSLQRRTHALARKIFGNFCQVEVDAISAGEDANPPLENKYCGDHLCMLKEMQNGDHSYILNDDGTSKWPELGATHKETCPYWFPDLVTHPSANPHEDVMPALLQQIGISATT